MHSSESTEWYTPAPVIHLARQVLGGIDLDPASSAKANATVGATRYYTMVDDGLAQPWYGHVWLNPPYNKHRNQSNQGRWARRLIAEYETGTISAAILLVNASTGALWFDPLWAYPICFWSNRVPFIGTKPDANNPTHYSALVYFGTAPDRFARVFRDKGRIVPPDTRYRQGVLL